MYNYLKENRTKVLLVPLIIYWIVLFIATSLPSTHFVDVFEISDKIKHFGAYFILSALLGLNLHFQEKWKSIVPHFLSYTFILCTIYGLLDEIHQIFVPNRSAEFLDWVADVLGTLLGVIVVKIIIKNLKQKHVSIETNS